MNSEIDSLKYVDHHCHLYAYDNVDSVISKAKESGVVKIVAVSPSYERAIKNQELMKNHKDTILLSIGYGPKSMVNEGISPEDAREKIESFLDLHEKEVFSIGEIGLYEKYRGKKQRDSRIEEMLK